MKRAKSNPSALTVGTARNGDVLELIDVTPVDGRIYGRTLPAGARVMATGRISASVLVRVGPDWTRLATMDPDARVQIVEERRTVAVDQGEVADPLLGQAAEMPLMGGVHGR